MVTWDRDLLLLVASHLDPLDLVCWQRVSKYFHSEIEGQFRLSQIADIFHRSCAGDPLACKPEFAFLRQKIAAMFQRSWGEIHFILTWLKRGTMFAVPSPSLEKGPLIFFHLGWAETTERVFAADRRAEEVSSTFLSAAVKMAKVCRIPQIEAVETCLAFPCIPVPYGMCVNADVQTEDVGILERYAQHPKKLQWLNVALTYGVLGESPVEKVWKQEIATLRRAIPKNAVREVHLYLDSTTANIITMIMLKTFYFSCFLIGYVEEPAAIPPGNLRVVVETDQWAEISGKRVFLPCGLMVQCLRYQYREECVFMRLTATQIDQPPRLIPDDFWTWVKRKRLAKYIPSENIKVTIIMMMASLQRALPGIDWRCNYYVDPPR